ncbi:phosphatase [Streptomyces mashuensis]|uniref:Phosphatase n=1 Tax=Streptomyces mashuensis TaxID=33904 RepID=A0A919AXP3_9ACTN|nr:HAD-IA family hydrolase [Streptomyces mashuensis]GHF28387.1 phosphatase [Streptomyces mashuensis]
MATIHSAVLFDLDGTLVDSYQDAEDCWGEWARSAGVGDVFDLADFYGQKRADIVRTLLPHLTEDEIRHHAEQVRLAERARVAKVVALPGAAELLASLPRDRWALVTSNDTEVAQARLRSAGLPVPDVIVSADDVLRPKPDPEGFLLAAQKLGVDPATAVGVDDSPHGIAAARAAGMTTVAVRFRHGDAELAAAHTVVDGVGSLSLAVTPAGIRLSVPGDPPGVPS